MINKQKLWFLTLFSLILVLSVYYVTMPNNTLKTVTDTTLPVVNIKDEDEISILKELSYEEKLKEMEELKVILNNLDSTVEERNNAYEKMKLIEDVRKTEDKLEDKIKKEYNLESFVKIDNNQIKITIKNSKHTNELANNIMRSIQEEYKDKMYISVKFI